MATSSDAAGPKPTEAGLTHWELAGEFKGEGGYKTQWKKSMMREELKRALTKDSPMQPSHTIKKLVCIGLGSLSVGEIPKARITSMWQLACCVEMPDLLKELGDTSRLRLVGKPLIVMQDPAFNANDNKFLSDVLQIKVVEYTNDAREDAWSFIDSETFFMAIGFPKKLMPTGLLWTKEGRKAFDEEDHPPYPYDATDASKTKTYEKESPAALICEGIGGFEKHESPIKDSHTEVTLDAHEGLALVKPDGPENAFCPHLIYIRK